MSKRGNHESRRIEWARRALLGVSALALSATFAFGQETKLSFDIPAQPTASALKEFARQADLQLTFPFAALSGRQSPAVIGDFDKDRALDMLIEGTGLEVVYGPDDRVTLRRPAPVASSGASSDAATMDTRNRQVAQLQTEQEGRRDVRARQDAADEGSRGRQSGDEETYDEIVVTGTLIRGAAPVGAQLFTFDRTAIDRTGFSTAADVIQSLPQTLGAGPNPDTTSVPGIRDAAENRGLGSSVNLRGLGADSTLTLINGRRVAPGGADGGFVDVSLIPLTAIERIEVLTDGASALYGSDAVAGVVNIVLRDDYEGAETRFRFGSVTNGGQQEYQVGQVFGTTWASGHALIAYEYLNQDPLFSAERTFAADSDLSAFGGDNFNSTFANPGNIVTGGQFAIPAGQDGTSLTPGDLLEGEVNLQNERLGTTALPSQERHSLFATASQELGENLEVFAEARYTDRNFEADLRPTGLTLRVPSTNPFFVDPVGGSSSIQVQYSFFDDLGPLTSRGDVKSLNLSAGGTLEFLNDWQAEFYGSYSREKTSRRLNNFVHSSALNAALADPNPETAFNPFADGSNTNRNTLESIREFSTDEVLSDLWSANLKADGSLFHLPGGDVKLAVGLHYREEGLETFIARGTTAAEPNIIDDRDFGREVFAAFGEIRIPLVGPSNAMPVLKAVDVSVAGRFEDYSDFGSTTNPKVGLAIAPIEGLSLRATYSTSFRAPLLTELDTSRNQHVAFRFTDPGVPAGVSNQLNIIGGNDELGPEEATIWSVGFDLRPTDLPGFTAGVTYFDIEVEGRITGPGTSSTTVILANEDTFANFITRNPDPATVEALLNDPTVQVLNFLAPDDVVDVIVDFSLNNSAQTSVRGIDATLSYSFDTDFGEFSLSSNSSYFFEFEQANTPTSPFITTLDTLGGQPDFRTRNSLSWAKDGLSANVFVNHTDGYTNNLVTPATDIDSWTTVDLNLSFGKRNAEPGSIFGGTLFSINVQNLFDQDPPFVNNPNKVGFDPVNSSPRGRFIALQVVKQW